MMKMCKIKSGWRDQHCVPADGCQRAHLLLAVFKHPGNLPSEDALSCSPWGTCSHRCLVLPSVTARALVDPGFSWITVARLRASFYERAASGSSLIMNLVCKDKGRECHKLLLKTPCNEKLLEEIPGEFLSLQAQSQLIGWLLIVSIMTVALIVTRVIHCRSPVSYLQLKFWKICSKKGTGALWDQG